MQFKVIPFGTLEVSAVEMFNHFPPARISRYYHIDPEGNMRINMNSLLVERDDRIILFDPGCAGFLPARTIAFYGLRMPGTVEEIMLGAGYKPEQVTDVIFTHLHFDHGSGAFKRIPGKIVKAFPGARYHVLKEHFRYASRPKRKEKNSFFTTFFKSLEKIWWLEEWDEPWMDFITCCGHTEGMVVPRIKAPGKDIWFLSDLIPMEIFLEPDVSSEYDLNPELAMAEKRQLLAGLTKPAELVLFHDPNIPKIEWR